MLRQQMAGGPRRPVGEGDRVRADAGQGQSLALKAAPCAFKTISDGTMSTLTDALPGGSALAAPAPGVCAYANNGVQISTVIVVNL
jgi:hypothetical protein